MLTAAQSRSARGLLNWTQVQLAEAAQVSIGTVRNFEVGRATPIVATLNAIRSALEEAGVEFLDSGGVQPRQRS
ncbi:helix-turn-helix domain-containing protein [Methylobacterium sp. J-048]|uniref:helix-turn-helix transcriptional regulator n=1 Tax=Methylobacterium sp. J-048 TaxID=2836635 RepID=UPI001FBA8D75|nr:helix-turn-helix transcriptional regulator [Methylobacterium sp. J-048]MCJ2059809.1 helix-turn-helix domain-containing protein [Methylobacterium sp. J-048]